MKIGSAFPSTYLKAADLNGKQVMVRISHVAMEDIGGEHKPVVYFQGSEKGLVLNKTNSTAITEIAGTEETDDWAGVRIMLYSTKVDFQGKRVDALRVDVPPKGKRAAPPPPPDEDFDGTTDDDRPPF